MGTVVEQRAFTPIFNREVNFRSGASGPFHVVTCLESSRQWESPNAVKRSQLLVGLLLLCQSLDFLCYFPMPMLPQFIFSSLISSLGASLVATIEFFE
jgi:hypothetical protein